jgi:hypothetical protein
MKSIAFALLFMVASQSYAGCIDLAEYKDERMRIYIGDGGCGKMEIIIWEYKDEKSLPSSIKHIDFDKECSWKYQFEDDEISCQVNPENPLSGATYKKFRSGSYTCPTWRKGEESYAYKYKCVKNCSGKLPFLQAPKSCD